MSTNQIVSKVCLFCNTLQDDGPSYGDYLEQLTYLLFLKMADEYTKPPYSHKLPYTAGVQLAKPLDSREFGECVGEF